MNKIKVLVVEDSAFFRQMLSQIISEDEEIEVIGTAIDPIFAMEKIMRNPPDVITLDVEMPRMDGLTFLEKLMKSYPIPVIMVSSWTQKGCKTTLKALELGAVDFIAKPERNNLTEIKHEIIAKIKNAARVNLNLLGKKHNEQQHKEMVGNPNLEEGRVKSGIHHKVVAIGASTGGVIAVNNIIDKLKPAGYSILITLHMPSGFTKSFAQRLNQVNGWQSSEAVAGQPVKPDHIYVAPGGLNMTVEKRNGSLVAEVKPCEPEDIYKPNVNKTFASMAKNVGTGAIGVILTGMGDDGAKGLLMMKQAGSVTIAQNEETCMVFGMPKRAIEVGAVDYVVPLNHIAGKIMTLI
ncbi:MAG: chemotaxis response regulator protein-glutamate methylesterase [Clostridia bacterium]|nr:chemotaxis response regulator protein-glutamate methylesterase [Clostridia bacterium]